MIPTSLLRNRSASDEVAQALCSGTQALTPDGQVLQDILTEHGITNLQVSPKKRHRVPQDGILHRWLVWDCLQSLQNGTRRGTHYCIAIQGWLYKTVIYDLFELCNDSFDEDDLGAACTFNVILQTNITWVSFGQATYWAAYPYQSPHTVEQRTCVVSESPEYLIAERRSKLYQILSNKKLLPDIPGI